MHLRLPFPATLAGIAAGAVVITTTASITPLANADRMAHAVSAAPVAGQPRQVLLMTGDRVIVPPGVQGGPGVIVPATRRGLGDLVMSVSVGGVSYDIPDAALPYLDRGLDPRLFSVKALLAHERSGQLPVRVTYTGPVPALPGVKVTRSSRGTAEGYLTVASARTFGAALDRQYLADHARGSYGTDGMFASGTSITLAASAPPAPHPRPAFPMRTLTVKGFNLAGTPDTGDSVLLFNVDNTNLVDPSVAGIGTFYRGVAKFSVPTGHYMAVGNFIGAATPPPVHTVTLPQFTVAANRAITIRESAANSKITMVTPRPAVVLDTNAYLLRTGAAGPTIVLEALNGGNNPLWENTTTSPPTVGTLREAVNQHLESPRGRGVPYEYTLSFTGPPGIIPTLHYLIRPDDIATISERFYQPTASMGQWVFSGSFPGTNPNNSRDWFGFVEPFGLTLKFPGRLTEYAGGTGSARMEWGASSVPARGAPFQSGKSPLLHPGEHLTDNWNAYPLHPAPNAALQPRPNMFAAVIPSAVRAGNTLTLDLNPFGDNQTGHQIGQLSPFPSKFEKITGSYQIDQNGTTISGGDAAKQAGPFFEFHTAAQLGTQPSVVRFSLDLAETGTEFPHPNVTDTVWTWRSAPDRGGMLPSPWACQPLTRTRDCAVEPMMTLRYSLADLALNETVPPGRQTLRLQAGHIPLARAAPVTMAAVMVSFDGGKTWHPATVTGQAGDYTARFTAPAGATVSLRTSAADAAGGSITETITSAYQTAP